MDNTFDNLKIQLDLLDWPTVYLFKFISPNDSEKIARVTALFDDGTDLNYQNSKTGKYVSISVKEMMLNSESVIEKYQEASKIKGVMIL